MASIIRISILADAANAVRGLRATSTQAGLTAQQMRVLDRQVKKLDGQRVQVGFDAKGFAQGTAQIIAANLALDRIRKGLPDLSFGLTGVANKLALIAAAALAATAATGPLVAVGTALGVAFGAAAAGVALFGAAAVPVLKEVTEGVKKYNTAQDALKKAQATGNAKAVVTAQKNMAAALATLTPLQRESAKQLIAMQDAWAKISDSQAPTVLGIISKAAGTLNRVIPKLAPAIGAMGKAISGVSGAAFEGLEKAATPFAKFITTQGVPAFKLLSGIIGNLLPTVGHLAQAFAPLGNEILAKLAPLTATLRSIDFTPFARSARDLLPVVSSLLGNLAGAVGNLLKAVAPLARPVLQGLSDIGGILKTALGGPELRSFISNIAKIVPAVAPIVAVVVPAFLKFADIISGQVLALVPKLLPIVHQLADVFINVLTGLSPLLGPLLDLIAILVSFIPVVFPVITALRDALLPVFAVLDKALVELKPSLTEIITAFSSMFRPISAILITIIKMAPILLASLVPAFVALVGVVNSVLIELRPLFPVIGKIIATLATGLTPVIQAIATAVPPIAAALVSLAAPVAGFVAALVPLFPVIAQIISALAVGLVPVIQAVAAVMPTVIAAVVPLVPELIKILQSVIPLIQPLSELAVLLITVLTPIMIRLLAPITDLARLLGQVLPGSVAVVSRVIREVTSIIRDMANMFNAVPGLASRFADLANRVISYIGDLPRRLFEIAGNVIDGFVSGIRSRFDQVRQVFNDLTGRIPSWKGPPARDRKLLADNGKLIMGSLIAGIESKVPDLRSQLGGVSSLIQGGISATADIGLSRVGSLPITLGSAQAAPPVQVNINVAPGADAAEVGRQAVNAIEAYERRTGRRRLAPAL